MSVFRHCPVFRIRSLGVSLVALACGQASAFAEMSGSASGLPVPVTDAHFSALRDRSPFLRNIGLSQSLVLTGVARIEEDVFATLFDMESKASYVVSGESNSEGWQLMGVDGNQTDLKSLTAQIKVAGAEVVSIRYEPLPKGILRRTPASGGGSASTAPTSAQLAEAKHAAVNYREGFDADGYSKAPPPEMVAKLARLSVDQREDIARKMFELNNRGMKMEERRPIYEKLVDRELENRK